MYDYINWIQFIQKSQNNFYKNDWKEQINLVGEKSNWLQLKLKKYL